MMKHESMQNFIKTPCIKGEMSFYRFLLITGNLGNIYVENLIMSNLICLLFKMMNIFGFFQKKIMQIIRPFLGIFIKFLFTLGFKVSLNLGCKKKRKKKFNNQVVRTKREN